MRARALTWTLAASLAVLPGTIAAGETYESLLDEASVWSQAIDARTIDLERPAEYREHLGVFPVGNGECFTYLGLGVPQNTLFMLTGPRYQTDGNHNPRGGFGESAVHVSRAGKPVSLERQMCHTVRGAPIVLTREEGPEARLDTVTFAPPGVRAILRQLTLTGRGESTEPYEISIEFQATPTPNPAGELLFRYPHRGRVATLRPIVLGAEASAREQRLVVTTGKLAPGESRTILLALVLSESDEGERRTLKRIQESSEALLDDTLAWWRRKLAPTLHVTSGDRRLDDLVEGLKVLLVVQQDAAGGVSPMVNFKGVWLRDSNGPLLGFLGTGLFDEARRLLTYYRQVSALHRFTGREFPLDLDVSSDPDLSPEEWAKTGTDRCEVPSFVVLQHLWWLDATGDRTLLERHWPYLRRNATHQHLVEGPHGPLQTFNGDETYMGGAYYSLFPGRSGYPNALIRPDAFSADSMFEYVAAQEAMVRMARALGRRDEISEYHELGRRMRESLDRHFWLEDVGRYAPALSPVDYSPHRAPFAPINLRPLWLGYLGADDPRARRQLDATLRWLWRPNGLVRMTPFLEHFIGCAPGYLVANLTRVRHPLAPRAFAALLDSASKSGEWVEVHKPDRPSYGYGDGRYANRLRPWESGVNLDAILRYLTGAEHWFGREIRFAPLLPPGCDRLVVDNIPLGGGSLQLVARRVGQRVSFRVHNTGSIPLVVHDEEVPPGGAATGRRPLPPDHAADPPAGGVYSEPLRWTKNVRQLSLTGIREEPRDAVQVLDVGRPFSAEDFARFLAARPESLESIAVHSSAQRYDRSTLKPLDRIFEHPRVKPELEAFRRAGGRVLVPFYVREFDLAGPFPDPDQKYLEKDPGLVTAPSETTSWQRHSSPSSYINLDAVLRPNERVVAFARCAVVLERSQRIVFSLGADDGTVLWVGGRRVIERLGHHHHQYDRDRVSVELPAGATPVVVGVHEIGGAWGFSLRLSDDRGQPPEGVVLRP